MFFGVFIAVVLITYQIHTCDSTTTLLQLLPNSPADGGGGSTVRKQRPRKREFLMFETMSYLLKDFIQTNRYYCG